MTKILYFDTNAVAKYFHKEVGSDVVKWIVENRVLKRITINTGKQTVKEFSDVIRKIEIRGDMSHEKAQLIIKQAESTYFPQIFRVRDDRPIPGFNCGDDVEFDYLLKKYKLREGKTDWDARHIMCVVNCLRCFGGISTPRVVTSDNGFKKIIQREGYQVIDPENITISELEIALEKMP